MQTKTLIKLIIALVVLIGLWQLIQYRQKSQSNQISGWGELGTGEVNPDNVNKIVINNGTVTLELNKPEVDWLVDGTAANINKVNELLEILKNPQSEVISQNKDRYTELGISDDQAEKLSFWQGDSEKLTILVSSDNSSIIRKTGHQNVYLLSTPLNLNTNISAWISQPTPAPDAASDQPDTPEPQL